MLVFFLAVGVGLDLGHWDWFWIGFGRPRVAIGLVLAVGTLDWFWIGFGLVLDWFCFFVSSPHNSCATWIKIQSTRLRAICIFVIECIANVLYYCIAILYDCIINLSSLC